MLFTFCFSFLLPNRESAEGEGKSDHYVIVSWLSIGGDDNSNALFVVNSSMTDESNFFSRKVRWQIEHVCVAAVN